MQLEQAGYETSCHATTGAGDATKAERAAVERKFDLVIAAGGDGTINEVVNGIANQTYRPKLGIIPVGMTNDFARAIGVPRTIEGACDVIVNGEAVPIDIGSVTNEGKTHYFVNIAGGGRLTELTYEVPSKLKTMLGQLAYYLKGIEMLNFVLCSQLSHSSYYLKGIEMLPSLHPVHVKIEYDGKMFEGAVMLFLVSLTNSVGGFEKLAPDSSLNDGMFDLIILKETNLYKLK